MKVGWKLCSQPIALWVQVVRSKYRCGNDLKPLINLSHKGSNFWKGMVLIWNHIDSNLRWCIGNGRMTRFWSDVWVPKIGRLAKLSNINISNEILWLVCWFIDNNGGWDTSKLNSMLPTHIIDKIKFVTPPMGTKPVDNLLQNRSTNAIFTTKSPFECICPFVPPTHSQLLRTIWH